MKTKEQAEHLVDAFIKALDGRDEEAVKKATSEIAKYVVVDLIVNIDRIADALEHIARNMPGRMS